MKKTIISLAVTTALFSATYAYSANEVQPTQTPIEDTAGAVQTPINEDTIKIYGEEIPLGEGASIPVADNARTYGEEIPLGEGASIDVEDTAKAYPVPVEDTAVKTSPAENGIRLNELEERVESNWQYQNKRDAAQDSHFTNRINGLQNDLNVLEDKAYKGIAVAIAMASAPQALEANSTNFAIGAGHYEGESAMAVGISHRFEKVTLNLNVGTAGSDSSAFGAGIGYSF
ncbi:hypothetical protein AB832_08210 [Flavobacteriaceae bacterium (ex Bugula neritina AB1)]|nr:hypothetical protein AB832_08210 [Flavobacteriaceae bacterium (ex Bugula neritina AB1)]